MTSSDSARRRNVLALTSWSFRSGLIQTYTLPYLRLIRNNIAPNGAIHLVTLEQDGMALTAAERQRAREELSSDAIEWHTFRYRRFGLAAAVKALLQLIFLARLCKDRGIDCIHCFCTPAGATGYLLSLLTGLPLVIDSYEPHAESMVENGTWKSTCLAYRILFLLERLQSKRAETVIATVAGMRDYARTRYGAEFARFFVKPACVDLGLFRRDSARDCALRMRLDLEGKIVGVYAGKTGGIYLKDEIFELFKVARDHWGPRFRVLFLTSDDPGEIRALCGRHGLDWRIVICARVEHRDMPAYLALADFALTPVKPVPTKRLCTPIKDGEYWAMGLPVIITPGISEDSQIIADNRIGSVLRDLSADSYGRSVREIDALLRSEEQDALRERIRAVAEATRSLEQAEAVYRVAYGAVP